ncbi:MAG: hypothetical protein KME18_27080 [Phormidium tanganyikae FI6-MK23]|jgi:hypothetical protein|nr:hypothetical protein [Phormidium tanganyikae FI6-MK23]
MNHYDPDWIILKERIRQAHLSFNVAMFATTTFAAVGLAGISLQLSGRLPEGTATAISGMALSGYFSRLAKDANDRLDKLSD